MARSATIETGAALAVLATESANTASLVFCLLTLLVPTQTKAIFSASDTPTETPTATPTTMPGCCQCVIVGACVTDMLVCRNASCGSFVPGGSCSGGVEPVCVSPTPSATPTMTPTV